MKKNAVIYTVILLMVFIFASCNRSDEEKSDANIFENSELVIDGELPSSPVAQQWIQDAADDLADELGVPLNEIAFVQFDLRVWPNDSYGCPTPEGSYIDESKEGYQIHLRSNSRLYFYHGGEDIEQFLCLN